MPDSCRPGNRQITRDRGAAAQHDGVELAAQLVGRNAGADVRVGPELDALRVHDREPAIENALLHLEFRDAVAKQAADAIGTLEDRDPVPGLVQLIGCGEPRRPRADDGDALSAARPGRLRHDPALIERALDDRVLDALDRDRITVDAEDAGALARRRAEPAGELGKVVGRQQALDRRLPPIAVDEIVPVRNQVAEWTALVAERDAAVHAAGALLRERLGRVGKVDLPPIPEPLGNGSRRLLLAADLDEPGWLTHGPRSPAR